MNENLPFEIKKYIKKFGLSDWSLETSDSKRYKLIVVIPTLCEYENIKNLLTSILDADQTFTNQSLIVFVVNNLKTADSKILEDNQKTINYLREIIRKENLQDDLQNKLIESNINFGLVDASSEGKELPLKDGGVGLARKIGMDLSLNYFNYEGREKNILVCTDADSRVEKNYFTEIYNRVNSEKINAGYVGYFHPIEGDEENQKAIVCYEIFLRYYVLAMKYAKSPYAIHTIGSTMFCDALTYTKIQGMNKRKAAEDFYFMEKLCKNTEVKQINSTRIYPSGRGSWRVPFGTGQRVNRFLSNEVDEYQLYSPANFEILKQWLEVFNNDEIFSGEEYIKKAGLINKSLMKFLEEQNFSSDWNKILANNNNIKQQIKQKKLWFDGFKTLKLIHFLRDEENRNVNMFEALDYFLEKTDVNKPERKEEIPSLEIQIKYLNILREIA